MFVNARTFSVLVRAVVPGSTAYAYVALFGVAPWQTRNENTFTVGVGLAAYALLIAPHGPVSGEFESSSVASGLRFT